MKVSKYFMIIILVFSAGFLSGCFALPVEEEYRPIAFFSLREPPPWRTVEVTYGDVELLTTITARHQPAKEEVVRFPVAGALITGIYVNVGDEVKEGDIIASLDRSGVSGELERFTREEARLMLRIEQLNERHAHSLWMAEISEVPIDDSFYINQRRDMLEDLYMLRLELDYFRRQYESRLVRAPIDGIVTNAMAFIERQFSAANHQVAVIADQTLSIFVVDVREAEIMEIGSRYEMDVAGTFVWVEVIDPLEWGIERPPQVWVEAILIADGGGTFAARAIGRINAVLAGAYDVLHVPTAAIHSVNDQHFVYVLEDGLRRLRMVEIGLHSPQFTEIIGGLTQGEEVVI
ncbi:MAG: efflux RND transporter periplasmic adaptor subunit [Defluviitaleaceae bacterium]|nr:efflux RND transporter periplasmic adaptor subunit [Defluviitaleaceae bacterium]